MLNWMESRLAGTQVSPQGWRSDSCECSSVIALQVPAARLISRLDCLNECSTTDWAGLSVFFVGAGPRGYGPGNSKSWGSGRETLGPMGPSPLLSRRFALWEGGAGLTRARLNPFGLPRDRPAGGPGRQGKGEDIGQWMRYIRVPRWSSEARGSFSVRFSTYLHAYLSICWS